MIFFFFCGFDGCGCGDGGCYGYGLVVRCLIFFFFVGLVVSGGGCCGCGYGWVEVVVDGAGLFFFWVVGYIILL